MSDDSESESECECSECHRNPAVTDDEDDPVPQTDDRLPVPDYSKFTLGVIAARRLRRPDILDAEILIPGGPTPGSLMHHLTKLSVELVAEVLSWLLPADLIYMSYMTTHFRNLLQSNKTIWKTARARFPISLPECPADTTEEQWALLLYNKECNFCGEFGERTLWSLGLTICLSCYPCKAVGTRWWLKHDIVVTANLLGPLETRYGDGDETALEEYKKLCREREPQVKSWSEFDALCEEWQPPLDTLWDAISEMRLIDVQKRLEAEGFDLTGVDFAVRDRVGFLHNRYTHPELTDEEWTNEVAPAFRAAAKVAHNAYLTKQRLARVSSFILEVLRDFPRGQSVPVPPPSLAISWPVFSDVKDIAITPTLSSDGLNVLKPRLLAYIEHWSDSEVRRLLQITPSRSLDKNNPSPDSTEWLHPLTTMFKCKKTSSWPTHTYEDICTGKHEPCGGDFACLEFDYYTSRVVRELAEVVGLDPASATTSSLDTILDLRFFCRDCSKAPGPLNWHDSIRHFFATHKEGRRFIGWRRQPQKDVQHAKWLSSTRARIYNLASFKCQFCDSAHHLLWSGLVEHRKTEHHREEGTMHGTDYEVDQSLQAQAMPRGGSAQDQAENLQRNKSLRVLKCTHCQGRKFDLSGLVNHAKVKHDIYYLSDADFVHAP